MNIYSDKNFFGYGVGTGTTFYYLVLCESPFTVKKCCGSGFNKVLNLNPDSESGSGFVPRSIITGIF
jgi:hypothetical protein